MKLRVLLLALREEGWTRQEAVLPLWRRLLAFRSERPFRAQVRLPGLERLLWQVAPRPGQYYLPTLPLYRQEVLQREVLPQQQVYLPAVKLLLPCFHLKPPRLGYLPVEHVRLGHSRQEYLQLVHPQLEHLSCHLLETELPRRLRRLALPLLLSPILLYRVQPQGQLVESLRL